jgi:hypothetical protein
MELVEETPDAYIFLFRGKPICIPRETIDGFGSESEEEPVQMPHIVNRWKRVM